MARLVARIAVWDAGGLSVEIEQDYPWLTRAEVHDALNLYEDHRDEIDRLIQHYRPPAHG